MLEYAVNVADTARLHVAALIDADIVNERLFAYDEPFTWNQLLKLCRKIKPDVTFPAEIEETGEDLSVVEQRERADEVLKKHFGTGFSGFEKMVEEQLACY
jgi:hypothetical protein